MEPFATVEDLESRWRTLSASEQEKAEVTLYDATTFIIGEMRESGVLIVPDDEVQANNLVRVTCDVTQRVLLAQFESGGDMVGVSKYQEQADVWSASVTYKNPFGDMYLTKEDKRLLGIGRVRVGSARAATFDLLDPEGATNGPTAGIWTP